MARKRYKPEEIVAKLRQVDVLVSQGHCMTEAIRTSLAQDYDVEPPATLFVVNSGLQM